MISSIRVRLLVWYAAVLVAVVGGFAGLLYYEVRAARLGEVDAQLETAAAALDASLRLFPPHELTNTQPIRPDRQPPPGERQPPPGERQPPFDRPRPDRFGGPPDRPRPERGPNEPLFGPPPMPGPMRDRFLNELTLPGGLAGHYFAVWRPDGTELKSVALPPGTQRPYGARPRPTIETRGARRELVTLGPHQTLILVGRSTERVQAELAAFTWQLVGSGFVVLVVGLAGGWLISRRIFRPVAAIAATASQISGSNLTQRIDTTHIDAELAELAAVLNGTFDRLKEAFDRQTQFTADASHELRTPLAVMRSQAELALSRPRTPEEYQKALASCLNSSVRMTDLVERLLALARADAGWPGLERQAVDFDQLVEEVVIQLRPFAEKRGVSLTFDGEPVRLVGDSASLAQVASNLLTNAIQYNHAGGAVAARVHANGAGVEFLVRDTGPGIPAEHRPHVFRRFFRVDRARSRASGGTGLGLAICKSIVEAHHGTIDFESEERVGTTFRVTLPCAENGAVG